MARRLAYLVSLCYSNARAFSSGLPVFQGSPSIHVWGVSCMEFSGEESVADGLERQNVPRCRCLPCLPG